MFYLDDKNMIDVEMMEDAKHPLSLFIDSELEAEVTQSVVARWNLETQEKQSDSPSSA